MGWQPTADRFVLYIDILGFKDFSYRNTHEVVAARVRQIKSAAAEVNNYVDGEAVVKTTVFSDSVLAVAQDVSFESASEIIDAAQWFVYRFLCNGFLPKGALAAGQFTADFNEDIFVGRPLIDAVQLQDELCAAGVILHHTAEAAFDSYPDGRGEVIKPRRVPIALRDGPVNHCAVNWAHSAADQAIASVENLYATVSGRDRRYVDNTIKYSKELLGIPC